MSSLVFVSRRLGKLALTRRAAPMAWKALSTRTQKKKTEEHTFHHRDFYGDENPQMREFFDSMEEAIVKSLHHIKDRKQAEILQKIFINTKSTYGYACDSPDGISDGSVAEEMREIHKIMDNIHESKQEIEARLDKVTAIMREAYAVDSPDGEVDGHVQEEMEEVKYILDHTMREEDKAKVEKALRSKREADPKRAADPEHW